MSGIELSNNNLADFNVSIAMKSLDLIAKESSEVSGLRLEYMNSKLQKERCKSEYRDK